MAAMNEILPRQRSSRRSAFCPCWGGMRMRQQATETSSHHALTCIWLVLALVLALSQQPSWAVTYVVRPDGTGDYPTIEDAIEACADGDSVALVDGDYYGEGNNTLDYQGRVIVLASVSGISEACVIHGGNPTVRFATDETDGAVLTGITISGAGTAIRVQGAARPTISNCIVRDGYPAVWSGAVTCSDGSRPTFEDCAVSRNHSLHQAGTPSRGGGIVIDGADPVFIRCHIIDNGADFGAGVDCRSASPVFESCVIAGNSYEGVTISGGSPTFENCLIAGNYGVHPGVGVSAFGRDADVTVTGCTIMGNKTEDLAGGLGSMVGAHISLTRTVLSHNCASDSHHEAYVDSQSSISLECCIADSAAIRVDGTLIWDSSNLNRDPLPCILPDCDATPTSGGAYELCADSPAHAADTPCGAPIGAMGIGCPACGGPRPTTWGSIKTLYRDQKSR